LDCASAQRAVLEEDLTRNAAAVTQVLSPNGPKLDHFAYPYGKVNPRARRIVARRFRTGRGIYPGINQGWADAALLMANGLYGPDATYRRAIALIGAVAREGGWLIFFTHDVSDQPSPYGAQAVALERVVRAARESGCLLLPVGEVAEAVRLPWSDSHERRERDIRRELES
jgi:peptidoglycan/xylan/chitin deacetylase (PgdA/CDA1 family)